MIRIKKLCACQNRMNISNKTLEMETVDFDIWYIRLAVGFLQESVKYWNREI